MRNYKKIICVATSFALVAASITGISNDSFAAKKASLTKKSITVEVGAKKTISIKNKKSKAKYTFTSSKKSVAAVSKKGVVTGKKKGSAKITVKEKLKKTRKLGVVKVTVKNTSNPSNTKAPSNKPAITDTPSKPTEAPTAVPTPETTPTVVPDVDDEPNDKVTQTQRDAMIEKSLVQTGNNSRIKKAIAKARAGEDVTLAYLGGSVTEGANAEPNGMCYAERSYRRFATTYGTGNNVKFINAGMSGTPSWLGICRYDRDVLEQNGGKTPDILFLEYSINDASDPTKGGAYEGIIRKVISNGGAVVLLFVVNKNNDNTPVEHLNCVEAYDLPTISMREALNIDDPDGSGKQMIKYKNLLLYYFSDGLHPANGGYSIMRDCIMHLFETIDKEEADKDFTIDDCKVANTLDYADTFNISRATIDSLLESKKVTSCNLGGFDTNDENTEVFQYDTKRKSYPFNWKHTTKSSSDPFEMKLTCKNLLLVYKLSPESEAGVAEIYVDGSLVSELKSVDNWNHSVVKNVISDTEAKEHTVVVKMKEGYESKEFTILEFGAN